jgi:hypothetical protein
MVDGAVSATQTAETVAVGKLKGKIPNILTSAMELGLDPAGAETFIETELASFIAAQTPEVAAAMTQALVSGVALTPDFGNEFLLSIVQSMADLGVSPEILQPLIQWTELVAWSLSNQTTGVDGPWWALGETHAFDYVSGWLNIDPEFARVGAHVADIINRAAELGLGLGSPSRVFMKMGSLSAQGFSMGFDKAMQGMSDSLFSSVVPPNVNNTSTQIINIHHPNHPTDDLTGDLQRASILAGFQGVAETVSLKN